MTSLFVTVDETTDTTLPVIPIHPLLPAQGALALWDCREQVAMPANGERLVNLAEDQALALGVSPVLTYQSDALDPAQAKIERTGKGALHGIFSQTNPVASGVGAAIVLDKTVSDYIAANLTHTFSLTLWHRVTRAVGAGMPNFVFSGVWVYINSSTQYGINPVAYSPGNAPGPAQSDQRSGVVFAGTTAAAFVADNRRHLLSFGRKHAGSLTITKPPSHMGYMAMLEDHTVSGRTPATLAALASTLRDAAFGAGGDFAGDTFTDPATLA